MNSTRPPRPIPLRPIFEKIPAELKAFKQFVVWSYEWVDEKKWDKPPRGVGYRNAKTNDPSTWLTCDEAVQLYHQHACAGIGFVLTADDPFVIIDGDGVFDPAAGRFTPDGHDLLKYFSRTRVEFSPSGTGVRIFLIGKLPIASSGKNKRWSATEHRGIEVYHSGKYFTLTGHVVPGRQGSQILSMQDTLTAWFHHEWPGAVSSEADGTARPLIPERGVCSHDSDEIAAVLVNLLAEHGHLARLVRGDWQDFRRPGDRGLAPSRSEADYWFARYAAQFAGFSHWLVDAVLRSTALWRPKWDRKLGNTTWLAWTIGKAIDREREWFEAQFVPDDEPPEEEDQFVPDDEPPEEEDQFVPDDEPPEEDEDEEDEFVADTEESEVL